MMARSFSIFNIFITVCLLCSSCNFYDFSTGVEPSPTQDLSQFPTHTPQPPQKFPTRLAWFYKPPADGNLAQIASKYQFFIMSKGDEKERDQLLSLGAHRPILMYVRFDAIMDPGDCNRKPWQNNAAFKLGDFCQISSEHPDWFLLDKLGGRYIEQNGGENFVMMNPGNPGWRAFFLDRLRLSLQSDTRWDGVFLDNVEATLGRLEDQGKIPPAYPNDESYANAVQGFLAYLSSGYFQPAKRLLFANLISRKNEDEFTNSISYLNGVMNEGWSVDWPDRYRTADVWESQMRLAEDTQALGKIILLISQGTKDDLELQKFAYASYLLINQGKAFFRYANSQVYSETWLFENYSLDLGEAQGARFQEGDAWRRNFSNGYVLVNPTTHEAQIFTGSY